MVPPPLNHDSRNSRIEATAKNACATALDPDEPHLPKCAVLLRKDEWIAALNQRGAARRPTVFFIDAWADYAFVADAGDPALPLRYDIRGRRSPDRNQPAGSAHGSAAIQVVAPPPFERYQKAFGLVQQAILNGESWLANLTAATVVETPLELRDIFEEAQAPYRMWVPGSLLAGGPGNLATGPGGFVVFSPEAFVRIEAGTIATFPMKGTRFVAHGVSGETEGHPETDAPGAGSDKEVINRLIEAGAKSLLADAKEEAEHTTVVDLLRNDLGRVASEIRVPRFRYVEPVAVDGGTLLQTSSLIQGRLSADWQVSIGTMLGELLPAGSVTGAPKHRTVEVLKHAEETILGHRRGWYAGVFGLFYGDGLDSAVSIRYIEDRTQNEGSGSFVFKSGGGITYASVLPSEYDELIQKVRIPIRKTR